jgi:class 3 adenylate cyclase
VTFQRMAADGKLREGHYGKEHALTNHRGLDPRPHKRDPEEARKILDPVIERMMEAVHRYEGTVNQVMGDGIMALLGAPIAHQDHAVGARYALWRRPECRPQ